MKILEPKKSRDAISAASVEGSGTGALPVTPSSTVHGSDGRQTRMFTRSSANHVMRWSPGKSKNIEFSTLPRQGSEEAISKFQDLVNKM